MYAYEQLTRGGSFLYSVQCGWCGLGCVIGISVVILSLLLSDKSISSKDTLFLFIGQQ